MRDRRHSEPQVRQASGLINHAEWSGHTDPGAICHSGAESRHPHQAQPL